MLNCEELSTDRTHIAGTTECHSAQVANMFFLVSNKTYTVTTQIQTRYIRPCADAVGVHDAWLPWWWTHRAHLDWWLLQRDTSFGEPRCESDVEKHERRDLGNCSRDTSLKRGNTMHATLDLLYCVVYFISNVLIRSVYDIMSLDGTGLWSNLRCGDCSVV